MNKLNILKALKNNRLRICMAFALALMMALLPAFNIKTLTERSMVKPTRVKPQLMLE